TISNLSVSGSSLCSVLDGAGFGMVSYEIHAESEETMAPIPVEPAHTESLEARFERLAAVWRAETAVLSSTTPMAEHPAYQEIIRMGSAVVPLLLRDLEKEPEHWFWALQVLTGANPVSPEDEGNLDKMTAAWLSWGRENGYHW